MTIIFAPRSCGTLPIVSTTVTVTTGTSAAMSSLSVSRNVGIALIVAMLLACARKAPSRGMAITSPAFGEGQAIPAQFTCNGLNTPPPLAFHGAPAKAKSLALMVTDPNAPNGTFTHWLVWNIPPTSTSVAGILGTNDFGNPAYGGPCPPSGEHRYFFTLYALDAELNLPANAKRPDVDQAMKGHVLAQATLTGRYWRVPAHRG